MHPESSSETVLHRARNGDEQALCTLLESAAQRVCRAIEADLPQRWRHLLSVEDVYQQTCVDAFCDIAAFAGTGTRAFDAWLTRIAKRNLLDAIRMLEAQRRGGGSGPTASLEQASLDLLLAVSGRTTPSHAVNRREVADQLHAAIGGLPTVYRTVLEQLDLSQRPVGDVARELGRSIGATYMLRARALRLLRDRLGDTSRFFSAGA